MKWKINTRSLRTCSHPERQGGLLQPSCRDDGGWWTIASWARCRVAGFSLSAWVRPYKCLPASGVLREQHFLSSTWRGTRRGVLASSLALKQAAETAWEFCPVLSCYWWVCLRACLCVHVCVFWCVRASVCSGNRNCLYSMPSDPRHSWPFTATCMPNPLSTETWRATVSFLETEDTQSRIMAVDWTWCHWAPCVMHPHAVMQCRQIGAKFLNGGGGWGGSSW